MNLQNNSLLNSFLEDLSGGIETLEQNIGLLENEKAEAILSIFRTFHSLKSGSKILNYSHFSDFLHQAENILSLLRSGELKPNEEIIRLLFQTIDLIKSFKNLISENYTEKDFLANLQWISRIEEMKNIFIKFSGNKASPEIKDFSQESGIKFYKISIDFSPDIFMTGTDPLFYIDTLYEKTTVLHSKTNGKTLPLLDSFDPTQYYLKWELLIKTPLSQEKVFCFFQFLDESANKVVIEELKETGQDSKFGSKENQAQDFVRVNIKKLDEVLNLFGELVSGFTQINSLAKLQKDEKSAALLENFSSNMAHLQGKILGIRMVSLSPLFNQFYRFTKETADKLRKQAVLRISGEETEVDKNIADQLREPLQHLLRNALDHGIENPEERASLGKNPAGSVFIDAFIRESNVFIMISDDGQGLNLEKITQKALEKKLVSEIELKSLTDDEIYHFIFNHGFSTKENPDELSGRGVGMDIVKEQIEKMRGSVSIETHKNKGSTFILKLPITLSLLDIFTFRVGSDIFGLPAFYVREIARMKTLSFSLIEGILPVIEYKGIAYPLFFLNHFFKESAYEKKDLSKGLFFLLEVEKTRFFLFADQLTGQQQAVVKQIPQLEQFKNGILGSSFLPDGEILFILDIFVLFKQLKELRIKTE